MRRLIVGLALVIVACGPSQASPSATEAIPTPSATPAPSPTSSGPLLFAALEAKIAGSPYEWNTVAIAGLDGVARAKTTFVPMPVPSLGCMGAILPPSAHVAAGKVFYADGKGAVRSLAIDGTITTVATFPMTSKQQMLSFAVSPDGSRILGTLLTLPENAFPCGAPASTTAITFDAYTATSGQASQLVYHKSLTQPQSVMALTGWDALGPIGTYPTVWASQGGGPGSTLGTLVRIDPTTLQVVAPFGDPSSCQVWHSVQSGAFVCTRDATPISSSSNGTYSEPVSVRQADGREQWGFTVTDVNVANSPYLAPDEQHVVICCKTDASANWLVDRQGHQLLLKSGFYASGWLDASTVYGFSGPTTGSPGVLSYVTLNAPGTYVSMGFTGSIVGTVRS